MSRSNSSNGGTLLAPEKWIQPDNTIADRKPPMRIQQAMFRRQREEDGESIYASWLEGTIEAAQELQDDVEILLGWQLGKPEHGKRWIDMVAWKPSEHLDRNLIQLSRWLADKINKGTL